MNYNMSLKKTYYKICEVSAMLNIPATTLRWWEGEFEEFTPIRTASGHRRYTPADIEVIKHIHELLRVKGRTLEGAKEEMRMYRKCPPRNEYICRSIDDALRLLSEAKTRTDDAHITMRIEAVEGWIKTNMQ